MKKIIIFGFPHSGTSILRTIISHIPEVYTQVCETTSISKKMMINATKENKSAILIKWPYLININKYKDYEKIFIIRNPMWIFSSLNIRFANRNKIPDNHGLESYHRMAQQFINTQGKNIKKLYHIRYEDMFDNNYKNLKTILNNIGLNYTDDIFDNVKYNNSDQTDNSRANQINKEFKNMNYPEKVKLKKNQIIFLQENIDKLNIYNIKD